MSSPFSRRSLLVAGTAAVTAGVIGDVVASDADAATRPTWVSGASTTDPIGFGKWRGSTVGISGLFGDTTEEVQRQQWQYCNATAYGQDVDLAVGGPIGYTWAQAADGALLDVWADIATALRNDRNFRRVYVRFAHEANGTWMPWSVAPSEVEAFKAAYRLFVATMRSQVRNRPLWFVFAPNFGTWHYTPESMFPGKAYVDVVGVSMYEWQITNSRVKWNAFLASSIGPKRWSDFARRMGRPLAFSEWGARSGYFVQQMNAWMRANAGTAPGKVLYDVYLNDRELLLKGATATAYQGCRWGR